MYSNEVNVLRIHNPQNVLFNVHCPVRFEEKVSDQIWPDIGVALRAGLNLIVRSVPKAEVERFWQALVWWQNFSGRFTPR
ncbi:MAG: hypothetical protein K0Q87_1540 [Neobacillus sp.]|nr:hypothetical protein [Neobacillus sp.]